MEDDSNMFLYTVPLTGGALMYQVQYMCVSVCSALL